MADELKDLEGQLKELQQQKQALETPEETIARLQKELEDLQSGRRKVEKSERKKAEKKNGINFIPIGRSGKALVPMSGKDVQAYKIKNLRFHAQECRNQAKILIERAEILENEANELEYPEGNPISAVDSTHN